MMISQAHVLLHFMNKSKDGTPKLVEQLDPAFAPTEYELESRIAESCEMVSTSYGIFKSRAAEQVLGRNLLYTFNYLWSIEGVDNCALC